MFDVKTSAVTLSVTHSLLMRLSDLEIQTDISSDTHSVVV